MVAQIIRNNIQIRSMLFEVYTLLPRLKDERIGAEISLERLLRHNPKETEEAIWLKRDKITTEHLAEMMKKLVKNRAIAAASKIKLFGTKRTFHLPMMDFKCEVSPENLAKIIEFLRFIKKKRSNFVIRQVLSLLRFRADF